MEMNNKWKTLTNIMSFSTDKMSRLILPGEEVFFIVSVVLQILFLIMGDF